MYFDVKNGRGMMDLLWKCIIIAIGLFALYWICKLCLYWKEKHSIKGVLWQVDLEKVFLSPLKLLFLSLGLYYSITFFSADLPFSKSLTSLKDFLVLLCIFWIAYRWKRELFQKKWHSVSMAEMLNKLLSVAFFIPFVLMTMDIFHIDIVPLLAFGGIGVAALGFAAKEVLGNFFGGGMISITRPFSKGDLISLPDRGLEGTVEEMGWYFTSIRDKDKRPIYFPNSLFSSAPVINISRMSHRRIYEVFHLSYQDFAKVTQLTEALRKFLSNHSKIDSKAPLLVYWHQVGEYSLEVILDVYTLSTQTEEYVLVRETLLHEIFSLIQEMGIHLSYPTSVVQPSQQPGTSV